MLSAPADEGSERFLWWLLQRAELAQYQVPDAAQRVITSARKAHGDGTWLGLMLDATWNQLRLSMIGGSAEARLTAETAVMETYAKAHELHPDRPEAAVEILKLRSSRQMMGDDDATDDNDCEAWFTRAVTAEFDDQEAYRTMIASVSSCPTCRNRFARACLATRRFDTRRPVGLPGRERLCTTDGMDEEPQRQPALATGATASRRGPADRGI